MTASEMIAAWDRGETIWSLEMGGLGPGYEQAIQTAAVEMMREGIGHDLEGPREGWYEGPWDEICSHALKKHDEALGGLSGAQYSAAKWLAWRWVHMGGAGKLLEDAKANGEGDRAIQVSKQWPRAKP